MAFLKSKINWRTNLYGYYLDQLDSVVTTESSRPENTRYFARTKVIFTEVASIPFSSDL